MENHGWAVALEHLIPQVELHLRPRLVGRVLGDAVKTFLTGGPGTWLRCEVCLTITGNPIFGYCPTVWRGGLLIGRWGVFRGPMHALLALRTHSMFRRVVCFTIALTAIVLAPTERHQSSYAQRGGKKNPIFPGFAYRSDCQIFCVVITVSTERP